MYMYSCICIVGRDAPRRQKAHVRGQLEPLVLHDALPLQEPNPRQGILVHLAPKIPHQAPVPVPASALVFWLGVYRPCTKRPKPSSSPWA